MIRFKRRVLSMFSLLVVACIFATTAKPIKAAVIFESGTLGPTGIPFTDLTSGTVAATNVSEFVFTGVRFQLSQPVLTSEIGGHFVERGSDTFFGAVVMLDGENDFPNSFDFSTPDFLGSTLLSFPDPSDEVFGSLNLSLNPGWYALVFGSGLFGATGSGVAVRNGADIGNPTYIAGQPNSGVGWFDITSSGPNHRFVINGQIVPETTSIALATIASLYFMLRMRSSRT